MNTKFPSHCRRCDGGVLLTALAAGIVIAITLLSYLKLVEHQNATVVRAQAWNEALAAAEAGVEEALAQLNPEGVFDHKLVNRAANSWSKDGGLYSMPGYPTPRPLAGDTAYVVRFTDVLLPTLYATGYCAVPALKTTLSRAVAVKTTTTPLYSVGMAALYDIKMNGNNIQTDSYNSTNAAYSTAGRYDPTKARDNGDVASLFGLVNVGNGKIRGDLLTGPTGGNAIGANGLVGDLAWSGPGIQDNHYANDFNMEYPDVELPGGVGWLPPDSLMMNKKVDGVTYQYIFPNGGDYQVSGLADPIYVGTNQTVRLYITGNVNYSGSDSIIIAPGGKLTIYMAGATFNLGGGGVVNNGTTADFAYYGLKSNTQIRFSGGAQFTGAIYAPQADFTLSGGGSPGNIVQFSGACVVKTVTMNGHLNFHFDESLLKTGPHIIRAYSWREL